MRILLVNTNRMKPAIAPVGLDYLADSLWFAGHTPRLLDLCFAEDVARAVHSAVNDFRPEAIGVTIRNTDDCYLSGQRFFLDEIADIIRLLRQASPAPLVLGGVGFSLAPAAVLEYCGGDFGIAGDGERALGQLLQGLGNGADFQRIPNLLYRESGVLRRNPGEAIDLATLPPRKRALVENATYFRAGGQAGFETKRGCPMACVYCADPVTKGATTRLLPPAAVAAELATLLAQGIDHFHTCDSEFNLPRPHAVDVCQAILAAGLAERIRWYAYCTPTPFDEEMAGLFKRAGCAGINFGADSGSADMLRRLGRHFTPDDLLQTARLCRRHSIPIMVDLLLGGPGETPETVRQSIELMRRAKPDCVGLSLGMRVYPGTAMARRVQSEGDPAAHPGLHGVKQGNPHLLQPLFYVAPALGGGLGDLVREQVAGDERFFLAEDAPDHANYNYNDNTPLVQAIAQGARGAYWDILRKMRRRGD
jgi:radical SAM superfamily enzyme YgiQ (UPF0313 family)